MTIRKIIIILTLFFTGVAAGQAQELSLNVSRAELVCSKGKIFLNISFDKSLRAILEEAAVAAEAKGLDAAERKKKEDARDALKKRIEKLGSVGSESGNFYIIKLENATRYPLRSLSALDVENPPNVLDFEVQNVKSCDPGAAEREEMGAKPEGYGLVANGISKNASLAPLVAFENFQTVAEELPAPAHDKKPDPGSIWKKFQGVEKDSDANFVGLIAIDGTKRTRRYFTTTVNFALNNKRRFGFAGVYNWNWIYANLNVTHNKQDEDVDTLEIGTKLNYIRVFRDDGRGEINHQEYMVKHDHKDKLVPGLTLQLLGKIETDWRFKVVNIAPEIRGGLPFNIVSTRYTALRFEPYVGLTLGRTVKGLESDTIKRNPWIVRPSVGGDLYFSPFRREGKLPVVLSVGYVRRWPLFPEPFELSYENALTGKKVTVKGVSSRVRDYALAKLDFDFGRIFSPYIQYEWGRQTPNYKLINSRYTLGVKLKFKYGAKK